jgi:hypothetical protein
MVSKYDIWTICQINRLWCQSMTYEQYNTMNINKGNNKITEQSYKGKI